MTATMQSVGALAVEMPVKALEALASNGVVNHISRDQKIESFGHITATTGADLVRKPSTLLGLTAGLDGKGITIAVLDSGIDLKHVALAGAVLFSQDFTGENRIDDPFGHGPHVASAIVGDPNASAGTGSSYDGIATGASLVNLRVLNSQGTGSVSSILSALNWVMANKAKYHIRVVNMSLGAPSIDSYKNDPICRTVRSLVDAGVVVVAAAGNNGKNSAGQKVYGQIHSPGDEPSALTVGAVNTFGTDSRSDDGITSFRSRGPTRGSWTDANGVKHYDNQKTGRIVWPRLKPKDNELALPISSDIKSNHDGIAATEVIGIVNLAPLPSEVNVYQNLVNKLVKDGGYKLGNIDDPSPDGDRDTLYPFPYDWRRDNVESAQLLREKIALLKQKLRRPDLKFDIVAHSTGGLIARYYLMYGGDELAGQGDAKVPWIGSSNINKLILISAPNEGSTEVFRTMVEGYTVIGGLIKKILQVRKVPSSVLFTMPSVYQLLPHAGIEKFYDSRAQQISVDLYDSETWRRYSWGIYDPAHRPSGHRPTAEQENYLKTNLDRARLFDAALDKKADSTVPTKIFIIGGDCRPTLSAVFINEQGGQTRTVFIAHGAGPGRAALARAMFEPGDGRVTRQSAMASSQGPDNKEMSESSLDGSQAIFECGSHSRTA